MNPNQMTTARRDVIAIDRWKAELERAANGVLGTARAGDSGTATAGDRGTATEQTAMSNIPALPIVHWLDGRNVIRQLEFLDHGEKPSVLRELATGFLAGLIVSAGCLFWGCVGSWLWHAVLRWMR